MPGVPPNAIDTLKKFGRSLFGRKKKSKAPVEETTEHDGQTGESSSATHETPVNVPAVAAPPPATENAATPAPQIEESREVAPAALPAAETIAPAPAPGVDVPKEAETVLPTAPQLDAPKKEAPIGEIDLPSTEDKKTEEVAAAAAAPGVAAAAPPAEK